MVSQVYKLLRIIISNKKEQSQVAYKNLYFLGDSQQVFS